LFVTLACVAILSFNPSAALGLLAGLSLVFVLPGAALLLALPEDVRPSNGAECTLLVFGLSITLALLCFWLAAQLSGFGVIERWLIITSVIIILLALLALARTHRPPTSNLQFPIPNSRFLITNYSLLLTFFVLLVAALLRFPSLGYGEFNDDELDVVQSARSQLLGQSNVIYEHRKGPTEIWLAAIIAGTSTQFDEWTLRLPFILASLGAIALTVLLGEEMLGRWRGVLAGLLLSGEGIFLAFSRMAQYQSIVLLMLTLVAWCAWRFYQAQTRRTENFYLAVGALCWSFAILTHWDGAPMGALLLWALWRKRQLVDSHLPFAICHSPFAIRHSPFATRYLLIFIPTLILPTIFYIQLFLHPQVGNLETYASGRIGFGLFNSAPTFLRNATFYNASLFIMALLLAGAWRLAAPLPRGRWLAFGLMLVPFVWQNFLQIADNLNLSLLIFLVILCVILFKLPMPQSPIPNPNFQIPNSNYQLPIANSQFLSLWLLSYFILYAFVIKQAGLHFYTFMPALALLCAECITSWLQHISLISPNIPYLRPLTIIVSSALLISAYTYDYVAYLRPSPEYALRYPHTALWWSPTFYEERPTDFFFAFPYRYGWSVIGELYRRGELRGKFESNETYLVTDWYVRDLTVAEKDEPRYYFRVDAAPRAGAAPDDLTEQYRPWGEVRVHGETKIHIYERKKYPATAARIFNAEDFPTADPLRLTRSLEYKKFKGDDRAFREVGRYLDSATDARDVIVLDSPLQDTILPYYYRGAARLVTALDASALSARTIYTVLWAGRSAERQLAQQAYPFDSRWFGSVQVVAYAPPLPTQAAKKSLAHFGEHIVLQDYLWMTDAAASGDVIRLSLTWRMNDATLPIATRYKVFVHVLNPQEQIVAQRDTEPMAELAPTTTWNPGEPIVDHHGIRLPTNLSPQALRVAVGLYDPQTGARLPVRDEQGNLQPDGRLLLGKIEIR
jgi:hypothetical protein